MKYTIRDVNERNPQLVQTLIQRYGFSEEKVNEHLHNIATSFYDDMLMRIHKVAVGSTFEHISLIWGMTGKWYDENKNRLDEINKDRFREYSEKRNEMIAALAEISPRNYEETKHLASQIANFKFYEITISNLWEQYRNEEHMKILKMMEYNEVHVVSGIREELEILKKKIDYDNVLFKFPDAA